MAVIKVTSDNYEEIKNSKGTVLLDFFATWCGPCKMLSPLIDQIAEENPDLVVGKVDVDEEEDLAAEYGVMSVPTLVVLKDGKEVNKSIGGRPKAQILDMLK